MVRGSRFLTAVGVATVAAGIAALVEPGLAQAVGLSSADAVVTALAVLALLQGIGAVAGRIRGQRRAAALPEVEARQPATVPGTTFDEELSSLTEYGPEERDRVRARMRERLEGVAVRVLTRRGLDESTARRHLRAGTWTADERATAFFLPPVERELTLGTRIRSAMGAERVFRQRARRTVAAITAHADGEAPLPDRDALAAAERAADEAGGIGDALSDSDAASDDDAVPDDDAASTTVADPASTDGGRTTGSGVPKSGGGRE